MEEESSRPKGRKLILVVDDDELMRAFYATVFKRNSHQFQFHAVSSTDEALKYLSHTKPDAIIVDWDMPGKSGIELIKTVKADPKLNDIRIFMISGRDQLSDAALALDSGAADYLTKPVTIRGLIELLQKRLAE